MSQTAYSTWNPNNSTVKQNKIRMPDMPCDDCGGVVFVQLRRATACDNCGRKYRE